MEMSLSISVLCCFMVAYLATANASIIPPLETQPWVQLKPAQELGVIPAVRLTAATRLGAKARSGAQRTPIKGQGHLSDEIARHNLTKVTELAQKYNLTTQLSSNKNATTVFAPTDAAFAAASPEVAKQMEQVFKYHILGDRAVDVIKDEAVLDTLATRKTGPLPLRTNIYPYFTPKVMTASGAVVTHQQLASNGVLYILDRVIFPLPSGHLVQTLNATTRFSTLAGLVAKAGLDKVLGNVSTPFTVLAPSNDAFDSLGPAALKDLTANTTLLTQVLLRHVVPLTYYSAGVQDGLSVKAAGGDELLWLRGPGGISVYTADIYSDVVASDVTADNGVVHEISKVFYAP